MVLADSHIENFSTQTCFQVYDQVSLGITSIMREMI